MNRQRGLALIITLWFIALLSILALGFSRSMRTETHITHNLISASQARQLAIAAIERGTYQLLNSDQEARQAMITGLPVEFDFAGRRLAFTIQDEQGKIDLNRAPIELLEGLLIETGSEPDQAAALAAAIADWRDDNDLTRLNGAEQSDYEEADRQRMPSNGPFWHIAELQQVLGFTRDIYRRIEPYVTLFNNSEKVNPVLAPRAVLLAIPGVDATEVEALISAREALADEQETPARLPTLTGIDGWTSTATGPVYTLVGQVTMADGSSWRYRRTLWLDNDSPDQPVRILDQGPVQAEDDVKEAAE